MNIITTNKIEFIEAINKMSDHIHGRDHIGTFSFQRYGFTVNNYIAIPISVMINELISFEETVDEEYRWKAEVFWYE